MGQAIKTYIEGIRQVNTGSNIISTIVAVLVAIVLGLIIYFTYKMTCKAMAFDADMGLAAMMVPVVVALLLSVIGTNIARAFSLAGALSIIRYRSVLLSPRNILFLFFGMSAGFICGVGLYIPSLIYVIIACITIIVYTYITNNKPAAKTLTVNVPESINFDGLLDETLDKYTSAHELQSVGVTGGGTLTELIYNIKMKDESQTKEFLDEIRTLNGNFKIQLSQYRRIEK